MISHTEGYQLDHGNVFINTYMYIVGLDANKVECYKQCRLHMHGCYITDGCRKHLFS